MRRKRILSRHEAGEVLEEDAEGEEEDAEECVEVRRSYRWERVDLLRLDLL